MSKEPKVKAFPKRKAIQPSVRFSVFKRDSFTCQYCGAKAPDVLLHVDHIKPVADGGENDLINLITSCATCNGGKGAEALDENAMVEKQRRQLEELTERRNQLEMLLKWRDGLSDLSKEYVQAIQDEFLRYGPWIANETGIRSIQQWLKRFSPAEIFDAIGKSFPQYLKYEDGTATSESWNRAFDMVPRIAGNVRRLGDDSGKIYYVRGIVRNRFTYGEHLVVELVRNALDRGANIEDIITFAKEARNWTQFNQWIYENLAQIEKD